MQNPKVPHINAVLRILRYLKKNPEIKLLYKQGEKSRILDIHGFVDAEWAGSTFDRRSTSGYCIKFKRKPCDMEKQKTKYGCKIKC